MKKIKFLLALPLAAVILSGCANVRILGKINDTTVTRVTLRGVFSPSSSVLIGHQEGVPGVEVLAHAEGPGLIPACATAGGIAGGAALLRPNKTSVSNTSSNKADSQAGNSGEISATSVNDIPVTINSNPPAAGNGHPNSPGNGGQPGQGGANNPNN